jgi:hypothetical protein
MTSARPAISLYYEIHEANSTRNREWLAIEPAAFPTQVDRLGARLEGYDVTFQWHSPECSTARVATMANQLPVTTTAFSTGSGDSSIGGGKFDGCEPGPFRFFATIGKPGEWRHGMWAVRSPATEPQVSIRRRWAAPAPGAGGGDRAPGSAGSDGGPQAGRPRIGLSPAGGQPGVQYRSGPITLCPEAAGRCGGICSRITGAQPGSVPRARRDQRCG